MQHFSRIHQLSFLLAGISNLIAIHAVDVEVDGNGVISQVQARVQELLRKEVLQRADSDENDGPARNAQATASSYQHLDCRGSQGGRCNLDVTVGNTTWAECASRSRCWQPSLLAAQSICNAHADCIGITRDNKGYEPRRGLAVRPSRERDEPRRGSPTHIVAAHELWLKQAGTCELGCNNCGYNWYQQHWNKGTPTRYYNSYCGCCGGTQVQQNQCKLVCSDPTTTTTTKATRTTTTEASTRSFCSRRTAVGLVLVSLPALLQ
eukprot:TRINITY_DN20415_c0_g1_i1.p1 TRINITY_DN20415_c0_g1~~TRINITY_DN20415_c0_g1_i1.p1  ORF type:complete len:264 (-),score=32.05 TRINITY_DN20415_c0_g1_i1:245-1036(-)